MNGDYMSNELANAYYGYIALNDKESFDRLDKIVNDLKAYTKQEASKFYPHRKKNYFFTNEEDRWITENACKYHRKAQQMCDDLNAMFGTNHTKNSVARRKSQICAATFYYTKEQEEWLKERFYLDRKTLTKKFNERFDVNRTVDSISDKMQRMKAYIR